MHSIPKLWHKKLMTPEFVNVYESVKKQLFFRTGLALGMFEGGMHFIICSFPQSNFLIYFWVNCVLDV